MRIKVYIYTGQDPGGVVDRGRGEIPPAPPGTMSRVGAPPVLAHTLTRRRSRNRRRINREIDDGDWRAEGRTRRAVGASGLVGICGPVYATCPAPRRRQPSQRRGVASAAAGGSVAAVSDDRSGVCSERTVTIAPAFARTHTTFERPRIRTYTHAYRTRPRSIRTFLARSLPLLVSAVRDAHFSRRRTSARATVASSVQI